MQHASRSRPVTETLESRLLLTGTAELVRDIEPGSSPSQLTGMVNVNGTAYFSANTQALGSELWKSDGTEAGTQLVKNIRAGGSSADPAELTNVNGTLYFSAFDTENALWKSDGSDAGTVKVKSLTSAPSGFTNLNGRLMFLNSENASGTELWTSDGTTAGTVMVKDIYPANFSSILTTEMVAMGNRVYFVATDGINGLELWSSDGTAGGTSLVKDIRVGLPDSVPYLLTVVNNTLFFSAQTAAEGRELWKSDGTATGTSLVKDITLGTNSTGFGYNFAMADVNGTLFFAADGPGVGTDLWRSDGTASGTTLVLNFPNAVFDLAVHEVTNVNGTVFFHVYTNASGLELWKSDGTPGGTSLVCDISPGNASTSIGFLTAVNGLLYFAAYESVNAMELWRSDGTDTGTVRVSNFELAGNGAFVEELINVNGTLFFAAADAAHGQELWKVAADATPAWLSPSPGASYSLAGQNLTVNSGTVTFTADAASTVSGLNVTVHGGGEVVFNTSQHIASLTIDGTGVASLATNGSRLLVVTGLNIAPTAGLDLFNNDLILDYSGASQLPWVESMIRTARNAGSWNGAGLTSSTARDNPQHNTTLGAMEASEYKYILSNPNATFAGESLDADSVLVKYTYYGDANFSGTVNFDDYVRIDIGFNTGRTGWSNGDFNFSNAVDFDDYVLIDVAFNTQASALSHRPGARSGRDATTTGNRR